MLKTMLKTLHDMQRLAGPGLVTLAFVVLFVFPAAAQSPSVTLESDSGDALFEQDPGFPECLGPDDPFCPLEPGEDPNGGGDTTTGCEKCEFDPDENGYKCTPVQDARTELSHSDCEAFVNGCRGENVCRVA